MFYGHSHIRLPLADASTNLLPMGESFKYLNSTSIKFRVFSFLFKADNNQANKMRIEGNSLLMFLIKRALYQVVSASLFHYYLTETGLESSE